MTRDKDELPQQASLIERLRDEIEQAKAIYDGAKQEYDRAVQRIKGGSDPDGSLRYAADIYNDSLHNYRLALNKYSRFLLDGRFPEVLTQNRHGEHWALRHLRPAA